MSFLRSRRHLLNILAIAAAFFTYYCMYAYRKPFSVLPYEGEWFGLGLKELIVIAQILGYTAAKFIGTKICAGLHRERVFHGLVVCVFAALSSLLLMAFLPLDWAFLCMFLNGLSLGMVWGMVMRPLEGRNASEFLMAGLCCSFIVASGDVKSVGKWVLDQEWFVSMSGGNSLWMPFTVGLLFLLPFLASAFALHRLPKPTAADISARGERHAMNREQSIAFTKRCVQVLIPLGIVYFMLTAYRDYRDNFQADLLSELGMDGSSIFSDIERIVAFVVVAITALLILFREHINALRASLAVMAMGLLLCVLMTSLRQMGHVSPTSWMIATGIGTYLCYIPFNCVLFERIVALTKSPGNAVFAIMLFDGIGYLGSIALTLVGGMLGSVSRLTFFDTYTWMLGIVGILAMVWSIIGLQKIRRATQENVSKLVANPCVPV